MAIVNLNGEQAFASQSGDEDNVFVQKGLTKREYFAGLAMQGLLAGKSGQYYSARDLIIESVKNADSLLLELSKTN